MAEAGVPRRRSVFSLWFAFVVLTAADARAAAWTKPKGDAEIITTVTYDVAVQAFDDEAALVPIPKFEKSSVCMHAEYGVVDWLTVRLLPCYEIVGTGFSGERNREQGINDAGAGARLRLLSGKAGVVSVEATYYTKGEIRTTETTVLSRGSGDIDVRALYGLGKSLSLFGRKLDAFADVQAGYRLRSGAPPNEMHADITLGTHLGGGWQVLAQSFNIVSDGPGGREGEAQFDAFRLHKGQLSTVYDLSRHISVQVGTFSTLYGRNIVQENAAFGALWVRF